MSEIYKCLVVDSGRNDVLRGEEMEIVVYNGIVWNFENFYTVHI